MLGNKPKFYAKHVVPHDRLHRLPKEYLEGYVKRELIHNLAEAMHDHLEFKEYQEAEGYVFQVSVHALTTEELNALLKEAYAKGQQEAEGRLYEALVKVQREAVM